MGLLEGKITGDVKAIQIAEIGAQGAACTFTIISKGPDGQVSSCSGSYSYEYEGHVSDGDVRNTDLEKSFPVIKETRVAQPMSFVRGHFRTSDGEWFHVDTGFGNHFFVHDSIAVAFLDRFKGAQTFDVYQRGIDVVKELLA